MTERCGIMEALALAAEANRQHTATPSLRATQGTEPGPNPPIGNAVPSPEANRPRLKAGATQGNNPTAEAQPAVVRIVVAAINGSAPREPGAAMLVTADDTVGTIGGGQLEYEAIAHARGLLTKPHAPWPRDLKTWPLGPSLGQCCGGVVRLLFEGYGSGECDAMKDAGGVAPGGVIVRPVSAGKPLAILIARRQARDLPLHVARVASDMLSGVRPRNAAFIPARKGEAAWFIEPSRAEPKPLFIYGAGHVGRAIVKIVAELDFAINWVDVHPDRFPADIPNNVTPIIAQDPAAIAAAAPQGAFHLVLTFSHALDLAICHGLLAEPRFGFLGLIGSASKRARFLKRLAEAGIAPATLQRLTCPIGIGSLRGKEPATIAVSVAAQLIENMEHFQEKWTPVRVKKMRQGKESEPRSDAIGSEQALEAERLANAGNGGELGKSQRISA